MRRRGLAAFVLGLASVAVAGAAIPFANGVPVTIAYNLQGQDGATVAVQAPQQTFVAAVSGQAQGDVGPLLVDVPPSTLPTAQPAPATTVVPSTPVPQDEPTATLEPTPTPDRTARPDRTPRPAQKAAPEPTPRATPEPTPKPTREPTPKATPEPTPDATPEPTPKPTPAPATYSGSSHFWYPALNIDAGWSWYGCDHGGDPNGLGAGIYRWGCGPASNIYLLSHTWSTFKKIRLAYHSGALKVGQSVWYSNAQGDVTQWRVKWIRRVTDDYLDATAGDWALNDSPTPIMTLQTCDGSESQYRIIVRLVPAD